MATEMDDEQILEQVSTKLQEKFPDTPPERVQAIVREEIDALAGGTVHDYVSVLAERAAKKRLKKD
jgi:translation initiation factor 2 alpha subunit (eIF-2alpha)